MNRFILTSDYDIVSIEKGFGIRMDGHNHFWITIELMGLQPLTEIILI